MNETFPQAVGRPAMSIGPRREHTVALTTPEAAPRSTLGGELTAASVSVRRAFDVGVALLELMDDWDDATVGAGVLAKQAHQRIVRLGEHLGNAKTELDLAIAHYDHDKLSDVGATINPLTQGD